MTHYLYAKLPPYVKKIRVTIWNSGGVSYGAAHYETSALGFDTSWSQMVDGTKAACTGVGISSGGQVQGGGTKPRVDLAPLAATLS